MSLREETERIAKEERTKRIWYVLLASIALLALGIYCFVAYQVIAPEPREIVVGKTTDFVDNVPKQFDVDQLAVSTWSQHRPKVSEDIIFVMHDQDGEWFALLGVDMRTGCFLHWDSEQLMYLSPGDLKCLETRYTPDGHYVDSLPSNEQPKHMARLKVEIREDDTVVVLDSLHPSSRQNLRQ